MIFIEDEFVGRFPIAEGSDDIGEGAAMPGEKEAFVVDELPNARGSDEVTANEECAGLAQDVTADGAALAPKGFVVLPKVVGSRSNVMNGDEGNATKLDCAVCGVGFFNSLLSFVARLYS